MASRDLEAQRQPLLDSDRETVDDSKLADDAGNPDKRGIFATALTMVLSIPALAGSCCWPLLLAGLAGITATAAAKALSHTLSFGLVLAALTNLAQYTAWKSAERRGTHWQKYGPLYLVLLAIPFIMADLTRHVLQDSGIWVEGSSMYKDHCKYSLHGISGIRCLSTVGWLFTIFFTYTGFILLIFSVMWAANMHKKIPKGWRELRNSTRGGLADQCDNDACARR